MAAVRPCFCAVPDKIQCQAESHLSLCAMVSSLQNEKAHPLLLIYRFVECHANDTLAEQEQKVAVLKASILYR